MRETVTVACADPKGIILRVVEWVEVSEPSRNDAQRMVRRSVEVARIPLNGYWGNYPDGRPVQAQAMNYGLTFGVDKELFEKWCEQNKETALVKNKVVFGHTQEASAKSIAKERRPELRYKGSDPLDPTMLPKDGRMVPKDPRYPRPVSEKGVAAVTTADR